MANKRTLASHLSPFTGRDPNSTNINKQEIEYPSTIPLSVTIEAAWCVTLYLYTGLNQVSLESRERGSAATKVCEIQPHDSLAIIVSNLQRGRVSDEDEFHHNTAIIFQRIINNECQHHLSEILEPGTDIALHVAGSGFQILARRAFMALGEVRNLGETFSHVLTPFTNNPNQTIRDVGISVSDTAQIISWNNGILTRTECLIHDEFSRVSHLHPHKTAIESWDGDMSYQELDMASNFLAGKLAQSGFNTIPGVDGIEGLEDIYCGSPMQDALTLSQSRLKDGAYEIDITWEVTDSRHGSPRIDPNHLRESWNDVVARHAALRTFFLEATTSTKTAMIHHVVLKKYRQFVILINADNSVNALERLASCASYKEKGLLLDKTPPHLLAICSTAQGHTFVRFQVNHILFDGTSISPLLRDLSKAYQDSHGLQTEWTWKPFADFIRYIRDEDRREEDITYWKTYLATARPCHFPALTDEGTKHDSRANQQRDSVKVSVTRDVAQLGKFLAEMQVTMPTLIQLTWAMVLRMYTADTQIVFGYLGSGRDAPVDNIQEAVGPFISILIHFLDFDDVENMSVADVLQRVQDRSARSISHQSCSLAEIQAALGITGNSLLFNSGISFMSKWTKEMQLHDKSALLFEQTSAHYPTEFDVSLIVETGDDGVNGMSVSIDYRHPPSAASMPPALQPRSTTFSLRSHKIPRCL